jgi:glycosyltransferase involved in cell wall biosynthesis
VPLQQPTDCGGNRDYAEHEKTTLVSNPDDLESLVNNVLRLLSDEELRVKIAPPEEIESQSSRGRKTHDD